MGATAKTDDAENYAPFKIERVQSWRATLRRATVWRTARYTKGDIEAIVVGITDGRGKYQALENGRLLQVARDRRCWQRGKRRGAYRQHRRQPAHGGDAVALLRVATVVVRRR
jgi:hypothetical protein